MKFKKRKNHQKNEKELKAELDFRPLLHQTPPT